MINSCHQFLTPAEMAKARRCSCSSLQRERARGDGPPFIQQPNGRVLYPVDLARRWLARLLKAPDRIQGDQSR